MTVKIDYDSIPRSYREYLELMEKEGEYLAIDGEGDRVSSAWRQIAPISRSQSTSSLMARYSPSFTISSRYSR